MKIGEIEVKRSKCRVMMRKGRRSPHQLEHGSNGSLASQLAFDQILCEIYSDPLDLREIYSEITI